jgi:hypothetical protein
MKTIIANNGSKLDKYLKLLYAEGIPFDVNVVKNEKQKIIFEINISLDGKEYEKIAKQIEILYN